jgi:hypothetical protein
MMKSRLIRWRRLVARMRVKEVRRMFCYEKRKEREKQEEIVIDRKIMRTIFMWFIDVSRRVLSTGQWNFGFRKFLWNALATTKL